MRVALCITVLNEVSAVDDFLASIAAQTRQPDEIVICDGGSRDGTVAAIERHPASARIRLLVEPGANISQGRNRAIAASEAPLIAVTDCGTRLEASWLERLLAPLEAGACDVAAGFFVPDPQTDFEVAMGATVLPAQDEIDERFLPSSRSIAFRREVWEAVGGYPEWLDYCEDLVFDFAYRAAGFRQQNVLDAIARFRPRSSLRRFFVQYYRYARGDGKAGLWRRRHLLRYGTYGAGLALAAALPRAPWLAVVGLGLAAAYCWQPWRRLARATLGWGSRRRLAAAAFVPLIRGVGDVAKMMGYPVGLLWRQRGGGDTVTATRPNRR